MKRAGLSTSVKRAREGSSVSSIVTLLTDFGAADYFVGAMKGVILSLAPDVSLVDITHDIPPQNISAGAFNILAVYDSFPRGTVHVCVVDPGVGSQRKAIVVQAAKQFFVGPDNGLFSYICQRHKGHKVVEITNEALFRRPVSKTFQGRDVFAPVAARLALGIDVKSLGREVSDCASLGPLEPTVVGPNRIEGRIIHIDHFGNCITNLTTNQVSTSTTQKRFELTVKGKRISTFKEFFAEAPVEPREPFAIWGSAGFMEIAATNCSAAKVLGVKTGDSVVLRSF